MFVSVEDRTSLSHPLEAEIGTHACKAVKHAVKSRNDPSVFCRTKLPDGISSIVECLELFSKTSPTASFAEPLELYPLHTTISNFRNA